MNFETLRNINQIIERDGKDTTYKFALLRSVIDIIQEQTPYRVFEGDRVRLPVGMLVLKWIRYYYAVISQELPQKKGDRISSNTLVFRHPFKKVTQFYDAIGGYPLLEFDLLNGCLPPEVRDETAGLCALIRKTILQQPMRYIGTSVNQDFYSIFKPVPGRFRAIAGSELNAALIAERFGSFTIPRSYYDVFELLGSFITGTHSIMMNWAQFTVDSSRQALTLEQVMQTLAAEAPEERRMHLSRVHFGALAEQPEGLRCVWSDKPVDRQMHIDHLIPFSVRKNNALWNLMPSHGAVNVRKRDKIPSPELLDARRDVIIGHWHFMRNKEPLLFEREITMDLIRREQLNPNDWAAQAFSSLRSNCSYLIEVRGFDAFTL